MAPSETALTVFFLCSAVLPLFLLRPALRNREKPGVSGLIVIILSASGWAFTTVVIRSVASPLGWWLTANVRMLTVTGIVVGMVVLTVEYTGRFELSRRLVGAVSLYPAFVQVSVWTNPLHHGFYRPFDALALGQLVVGNAGVLFFVHAVVAFLLIFACLGLLVAELGRTGGTRRKQTLVLLLVPLPPTVVNILLTLGLLDGFDPTPPAFVVSVFMMTWALVTTDFLDIVPVGRYRAVESMDDPTVTLDPDGRVVDCNPAARALVDADQDWEGQTAAAFFASLPEVVERVRDGVEETEVTVATDDGRRHFDLNCSPIRDARGESVGQLLVLREITLLKERERELREKNEALDEFAAVVSHDVATPLGVIENKAALIEMTDDPSHVEGIQSASQQVRELIDELRELARHGKQVDDTAPVEIERVCRDAWASVDSGDATLNVTASATIDADRARLRQLFENLFRNAVEHGSTSNQPEADDSVEHDATGVPGAALTVTVGTTATGFYVADDGPGIPEDERNRVFEQGYTTGEDHTGLGLAIVRRIVTGHGWRIDVSESDAGGARFEVHTD